MGLPITFIMEQDETSGIWIIFVHTIHQKVCELNSDPLYSNVEIHVFTAKDLQRVFEALDESDMQDIVGFIPNVPIGMVEYGALNEVVTYLLNAELPESKGGNLVVPNFAEKITFNLISRKIIHMS